MREEPWLVAEAVDKMEQHLQGLSHGSVLEFGMGGSTVWLSQFDISLTSVDDNPKWYELVKERLEELGRMDRVELVWDHKGFWGKGKFVVGKRTSREWQTDWWQKSSCLV